VELSKSIVSVRSPLSGTVRRVNDALEERPELVHQSPYEAGWLAEIEPLDWDNDKTRLVTGEAVKAALEEWAWVNRLS
jgi:glycine cleavage system H protein